MPSFFFVKAYRYSVDGLTVAVAGPGQADLPDRFVESARRAGCIEEKLLSDELDEMKEVLDQSEIETEQITRKVVPLEELAGIGKATANAMRKILGGDVDQLAEVQPDTKTWQDLVDLRGVTNENLAEFIEQAKTLKG